MLEQVCQQKTRLQGAHHQLIAHAGALQRVEAVQVAQAGGDHGQQHHGHGHQRQAHKIPQLIPLYKAGNAHPCRQHQHADAHAGLGQIAKAHCSCQIQHLVAFGCGKAQGVGLDKVQQQPCKQHHPQRGINIRFGGEGLGKQNGHTQRHHGRQAAEGRAHPQLARNAPAVYAAQHRRKALHQIDQHIAFSGEQIEVQHHILGQHRAGDLAHAVGGIMIHRAVLRPLADARQVISHGIPVIGDREQRKKHHQGAHRCQHPESGTVAAGRKFLPCVFIRQMHFAVAHTAHREREQPHIAHQPEQRHPRQVQRPRKAEQLGDGGKL